MESKPKTMETKPETTETESKKEKRSWRQILRPYIGNLPDITLCGANASTHTVSYTLSNDGKLTVVVFSLEGKPFDGNSQDILNICASNSITDISISDVTLTTTA